MERSTEEDDRPLSAEAVGLVGIDLDGTLLRSDGSICFQSAEAIMEAAERGVKVVLVSGRAPRSMLPIHRALGLSTLLIGHNGAVIYDPASNETIANETMPGPLARQIVDLARGIAPDLAIGVEVDDKLYTETTRRRQKQAALAGARGGGGETFDAAVDPAAIPEAGFADASGAFVDVLDRPVTKVMMIGAPHLLGDLQMALQRTAANHVDFSFSDLRLLQVVRRGVDKAAALATVAQRYGVPRAGVMAIGDAPNDVPMLRWAGLGVAMRNAWDEVRQTAHFTCAGNDDAGVAEAIKRYVMLK